MKRKRIMLSRSQEKDPPSLTECRHGKVSTLVIASDILAAEDGIRWGVAEQ